jgi:stage II sporulation protein D
MILTRGTFARLLFAVLAPACASLRTTYAPLPAEAHPDAPPIALPSRARVRLTLADPRAVVVEAPGRSPLRLEARGALVHVADGALVPRIELDSPEGCLGWEIEGRTYPGLLEVSARDGALEVVDELPLEEYVEGVVASELVIWSALPAELEAQAIVARTYAAHELAQGKVLADSTSDQAFRGRYVPEQGRGAAEVARRLADAVLATRGEVLARDGKIVDARFHAACGGETAQLADVFPAAGRGTGAVACAPCAERARLELAGKTADPDRPLSWSHTAGRAELVRVARALGLGDRLVSLAPSRIDAHGRWLEVELRGSAKRRVIPLGELRALLGEELVRSGLILHTWPPAGTLIDGGILFEGLGRGHGVGLCQEGARDYARRGWSAMQILEHYYPGAHVQLAATPAP